MVDESAKSLATWRRKHLCVSPTPPFLSSHLPLSFFIVFWLLKHKSELGRFAIYLGDSANVLVAVLLGETEVLVQAEADIVAVETVGGNAEVEEVLLERGRNGGFARGREAGQPDGEAALLAELVALMAREGRVPSDVAVVDSPIRSCKSFFSLLFFFWFMISCILRIRAYSGEERGQGKEGRYNGLVCVLTLPLWKLSLCWRRLGFRKM